MMVTVEISGILRRPKGTPPYRVELAPGSTSTDLIAKLGYNEQEQRALRLSRDGALLRPSDLLDDGDQLVLMAPIGGG